MSISSTASGSLQHSRPDESPEGRNAFDSHQGYSGQEYHIDRERAEGHRHPSGEVNPASDRKPVSKRVREDIPPENGRRAFFDSATGIVHGAGSSAGGGNPGEDFDSDPQAGSGYARTGRGDETPPADEGG
jgi:hypothetical protein